MNRQGLATWNGMNRQVRISWNDTPVLDGRMTSALAYEVTRMMILGNFVGGQQHEYVERHVKLDHFRVMDGLVLRQFHYEDNTGSVHVEVRPI